MYGDIRWLLIYIDITLITLYLSIIFQILMTAVNLMSISGKIILVDPTMLEL